MSSKFISREAPLDSAALYEYQGLSPAERQSFYGCRAVALGEGKGRHRAERDAIAAVLQHRRLHAPRSPGYVAWLRAGCPGWEEE